MAVAIRRHPTAGVGGSVGGGEGVDRVYVCLCACVCVCVCMCFCMHVYVWLWDICFGSGMGNMIQDHK